MKVYLILAVTSLILFILASSAMTVALYLLAKETYRGAVVVADIIIEVVIQIKEMWEFMQVSGAF